MQPRAPAAQAPTRHLEVHIAQHGPREAVAKRDVIKAHRALSRHQALGAGHIFHQRRCVQQLKHVLHVDQRLLDLGARDGGRAGDVKTMLQPGIQNAVQLDMLGMVHRMQGTCSMSHW
jgi:hypothetical protein